MGPANVQLVSASTASPVIMSTLSHSRLSRTSVALFALGLATAAFAPLAAQDAPGSFTLPEPTPTPSPAPAGPADERSGVAIPPRVQPEAAPTVTATPVIQPLPQSTPSPTRPQTRAPAPAPTSAPSPAPESTPGTAAADLSEPPPALPPEIPPQTTTAAPPPPATTALPAETSALDASVLPDWWPYAAGGLGALALLGGIALAWRRRKPAMLRLAAPLAAGGSRAADEDALPRLDLTLEITGATRSVMMFTLGYRLTVANRTERAVNDLGVAVQLASAQRGADNAPAPGAAQRLERIARVGPHQARSITGEVQLPLSAISLLRQGNAPLFIPLLHVTLEGEGQSAMSRSFVIGPPSASGAGRVHPILLDAPPGGIAGLIAQPISQPPVQTATAA